MYLDAVDVFDVAANGHTNGEAYTNGRSNGNGVHSEEHIFSPWKSWRPSEISHHGRSCCETAREWLFNTDMSSLNGGSVFTGPRWLRNRFEWGPGIYPIHWCDVLKKPALDCGIHAALAYEVFTNRGVKCYRAQFVQEFSAIAGSQWRSNWERDSAITAWIDDERIYHEGCAVSIKDDVIKIWDPSAGWWVDSKTIKGYGSVLALRIESKDPKVRFQWGTHPIPSNSWTRLKDERDLPLAVSSNC